MGYIAHFIRSKNNSMITGCAIRTYPSNNKEGRGCGLLAYLPIRHLLCRFRVWGTLLCITQPLQQPPRPGPHVLPAEKLAIGMRTIWGASSPLQSSSPTLPRAMVLRCPAASRPSAARFLYLPWGRYTSRMFPSLFLRE